MALKIDAKFVLVFSKMTWRICLIFVHWMKNSNFLLESKMVELNQNSTINKTFCTCSKKSLFLKYKQISKKAVKLGSFFQCSVHIFVGHDGSVWKINLRILWNHIMKNFQVKHDQCDSIIFLNTFSLESSK